MRAMRLHRSDLDPDPFAQFGLWFQDAIEAAIPLHEGMALATSTPAGHPSIRIVLLKGFDRDGFVFFTNYGSRKARELDANPSAALCFWWTALARQIRIEGAVTRVSDEESDAYFATRPRGSQLGAWASPQSSVIAGRDALDARVREIADRYADGAVARPPHWGGYRLRPSLFEFWHNQDDRLHDRFQYRLAGSAWIIEQLAP